MNTLEGKLPCKSIRNIMIHSGRDSSDFDINENQLCPTSRRKWTINVHAYVYLYIHIIFFKLMTNNISTF